MDEQVGLSPEKQAIREQVWQAMTEAGVARFPGARGRIPNFDGAARAAERLRELPAWRRAAVLKCNPDSPQLPVRRAALREGKIVYMAVPRLRQEECFLELDPARLEPRLLATAATIGGAFRFGRPVTPEEMLPIDLVVCGSVAVSTDGARVGKGGGFSDLEFALVTAQGKLLPEAPVVTTVHPMQVIPGPIPMREHDIPLDFIVTPEGVIECRRAYSRPRGIYWDLLSEEKIAAIPILGRLRGGG